MQNVDIEEIDEREESPREIVMAGIQAEVPLIETETIASFGSSLVFSWNNCDCFDSGFLDKYLKGSISSRF